MSPKAGGGCRKLAQIVCAVTVPVFFLATILQLITSQGVGQYAGRMAIAWGGCDRPSQSFLFWTLGSRLLQLRGEGTSSQRRRAATGAGAGANPDCLQGIYQPKPCYGYQWRREYLSSRCSINQQLFEFAWPLEN